MKPQVVTVRPTARASELSDSSIPICATNPIDPRLKTIPNEVRESMATIGAAEIKELRDLTGAGIMDCKRALEAADGDMKAAAAALAEAGLAGAAKKAGRAALEGVVESYIHTGNRVGSLVELNCETDFVARTDDFRKLAKDLAMQVAAMSPRFVDRESIGDEDAEVADEDILMEQIYIRDGSIKISDLVKSMTAKVGENVKIGRFQRFALGE